MEDQTTLSLEECLRLLEATFPFGENSEVHIFTLEVELNSLVAYRNAVPSRYIRFQLQ